MKYEVIKPFRINDVEFYVGDTFTQEEAGGFWDVIFASGSLRAKSEKREKEEKENTK